MKKLFLFVISLTLSAMIVAQDCSMFDITGLSHGTVVNNLFAGDGVTIQVFPNSGGTTNAVIYNSNGNWTEDPDLNSDAGNVIIMNENPNNGDGDGMGPDDNGNGGTLRFLFADAVTVTSVLVIDADHANSVIRAYDDANNLITTVSIPVGANGNVQTVAVNADSVSRLDISYPNSGGFRLNLSCPPSEQPPCPPAFDITSLAHGTNVNNYFAAEGVTIQVFPNAGGTTNAVIYNSNGNWTEDPDLNSDAGNVIIMNENPNNGDGDGTGPDDNGNGGTMRFLFANPVTVVSVLVIDADHANSVIRAYDDANNLITSVNIPVGANGNVQTVAVNADGASRLDIVYPNSGGFRLNLFCPEEPGPQPTICDSFDISGLAHGTVVNNLFADEGVTIQVFPNAGGTTNAVIYNSNGNWTEDPDLNSDAGNVIIMNENPNNGDGDGTGPDDNGKGGTLRFLFDEALTVVSVLVIDADHASSVIRAYNGANTLIKTVNIPVGADGNVQTVAVNASGVSRLDITYPNSGGFRLNLLCEDGAAKTSLTETQVADDQPFMMNAYPNPFTQETNLEFRVAEDLRVKAELLAIDGKTIQILFDGIATGSQLYNIQLDGSSLENGIYIYRLTTEDGASHYQKLMLAK